MWVPDAISVSRPPVRDDWPTKGFGRVLEEAQLQAQSQSQPCRACAGQQDIHAGCRQGMQRRMLRWGSAGCADADVTLEVVPSKEAAADACLAPEQDGNMRVAKEASLAREQWTPVRLGNSQQQEVPDDAASDGHPSVESKHTQRPVEPSDVRAGTAAGGGGSHEDSSAESSPCSSQQAFADAGSNAMFTPVPLVDRLPVGARSGLRLEQLPCPSPLPASCPATPAGQRRQPAPEESTPVLFGRPSLCRSGLCKVTNLFPVHDHHSSAESNMHYPLGQ